MLNSFKILIVEDNADLRLDLRDYFDLAGYDVSTAADGKEALDILSAQPVELIISDYEMPHVSGHMLRAFLRKNATTAHLPFIMISGGTPPTIDDDPMYRFLEKPVIIEELLATMDQLLSLRPSGNYRVAD